MTIVPYSVTTLMVLSILYVASSSSNSLENMVVTRYVDISTQLVVVNTEIKVMNKKTDLIDNYVYIVDPQWVENLSLIEVLDIKKNPLVVEKKPKFDELGKTVFQYNILLSKPLSFGETTNIFVSLILINYLKSYPKSVEQNEKHTVLFSFNVYYYSLYFSHVQKTLLYLGTTKTALVDGEIYTIANNASYGLKFGSFSNVEPLKDHQSTIHYENISPFLVVEKVNRYIKLSQWGYISVWEQIKLVHSGPKLKGPFKRFINKDKKNDAPKDTKISGFVSSLPRNAFDIYLKDEIGLIWNFDIDYDDPDRVDVVVGPRNILYGGWRTQYEIGYSLLISDYVTVKDNEYILSFALMDKIFPSMIVKDFEINIILPEGAHFTSMSPNFTIANKTDAKYCYYFDVICRQVISFERHNLVEKHIISLSVVYTFSQLYMIVKPLIIALYLYSIFILVKIFSKFSETSDLPETCQKQIKSMESSKYSFFAAPKKKVNKKSSKQKNF